MATENSFFDITTDNRSGWDDKFKSEGNIKNFIRYIYSKLDNKYDTILDTDDKITVNNTEQLSDINVSRRGLLIYVCSFTYTENDKNHTSIIISTLSRTFILHNYETDDHINNKHALFVLDEEKYKTNNGPGPKLDEDLHFFLEDNGKCAFSYDDFINGSSNPPVNKHINFTGTAISDILDYNAPINPQPFVNSIAANPILLNSYIYDKYIGFFAINDKNINVYNHISPDPYISITKDSNNFVYSIDTPTNRNVTNFNLSYINNVGNPEITMEIVYASGSTIVYNFTENLVNKTNVGPGVSEFQRYSIHQKYIPLNNNSTYISAFITFITKVTEIAASGNPANSMVALIKSKKSLYDFTSADIKQLCNNVNSVVSGTVNCTSEINLMNIIIHTIGNNASLFNFNVEENYYIKENGKYYNVYEKNGNNQLKKMTNSNATSNLYIIEITPEMVEVDINSYLNNPDKLDFRQQSNTEYYYYNENNINKQSVKINNEEIKKIVTLTDIKKYFLVTLEIFDRATGKIKNTKIKLSNMFKALNFKNKILIPTFMVFFVGDSLSSGYYITIQHNNNNWYVYDHKNRNIANYIDEYYFDEINTFPLLVLYKSFDGTNETIYNKLANNILKDDFTSNDDTNNYYLNQQYELIKYKERYIYDNYNLEEAIKSLNHPDNKYVINNTEQLMATEFFYGLNNDLNETTVLNAHTSSFIDNYMENDFNIGKINAEVIKNLF